MIEFYKVLGGTLTLHEKKGLTQRAAKQFAKDNKKFGVFRFAAIAAFYEVKYTGTSGNGKTDKDIVPPAKSAPPKST